MKQLYCKLICIALLCFIGYQPMAQVAAPTGWGDFTMGLVNDQSNIYNVRMKKAMSEGVNLHYRYTYINNGVDPTSNAISWLFSPWADYSKNSRDMGLNPGYVIYMLQEEGGAAALKNNIRNADFMRKYFSSIRIVAEKSKGYKPIFVIEPDTWSYFLQDALQSNSQSDPRLIPANVNNLGAGYEYLSDLPNSLSGVSQAIVRTIKRFAPDAYCGSLMAFWSVNANGVTGPPTADGSKGMVYWNQSDVDYSAKRNAEFAKQLIGTGSDRGDFMGVEKNGWSAGNWLVKQNRNDYYWNDTQNAKWVSWSKTLGQEVNLPLLGWQISIGHPGLPNTVNRYEDTFMPYFFSHTQDFMNAGFIGFLAGKGLSDCTDYTNATGNSLEANGSAGDNGWFFERLKEFDRGRPYLNSTGNKAPTISITSPANASSYTAPANITINANAADPDGSISKVEFYNGSTKLGEDLTVPYAFVWNNVIAGSYTITAKATDNAGSSAVSSTVSVTINSTSNNAPTVTITEPLNGSSFTAPAGITIKANASDTDGTISKVEFYQGTTKLGEDVSVPFTFTWSNVAAGTYNLTAKAFDNLNATSTSAAVTIAITNATGGCTEPKYTAGSAYAAGAFVQNTDASNKNKKYECKVGGWCSSPAAWAYEPGKGMYWTDAWREVGECSGVVNNAPTVNITSPSNNASFTAPASVTINANASDDGSVSKVEFYQGSTKLGEDLTSPYSYTWNNVAAGTYSITAKATDNLGLSTTSTVVNIIVNTSVNNAPTVNITSPSNNASFTAPASVTINANASDDGSVSKVEFFQGSTKLGEDLSSPYSYTWNNVASGSYSITAKATDNLGSSTTSAVVNIVVNTAVNNAPSVSITSPTNNASFTAPASVTINATASDDGSVSKVEFYQGSTKLGEDLTSPYSYTWNNVAAGTYSITAKATDNLGLSTTSTVVNIIVNTSVNNAPTVNITSPSNNASFTAPASVTINATASDDGSVSKVEFFQGSTKLGEDLSSPYAYVWNNVAAGSYSITAKATDNLGLSTSSAAVNFIVNTAVNNAPSVSITSPSNNASFTAPASVTINATASDDGSVSKVEFFQGSTKLGEDLSAPYSYAWNNVAAGSYSITAKATDNTGLITSSSVVSITVKGSAGCNGATNYTENGGYTAGSKVYVDGNLYECKPFPYSGWCNGASWAYGPGTGAYWADAWNLIGPCTPSTPSTPIAATTAALVTNENPFNDNLKLNVTVNEPGQLVIKLTNTTGSSTTLLDQAYQVGLYELIYNTASYPSGAYVLTVQVNGTVEKKMLMKQ